MEPSSNQLNCNQPKDTNSIDLNIKFSSINGDDDISSMDMNKYICQMTTKRKLQSVDGRTKEEEEGTIEIVSAVIESLEKEDKKCNTKCKYEATCKAYYNGQNPKETIIVSTFQSWLTTKLPPSSYKITTIKSTKIDFSNARDIESSESEDGNQLIFMIVPLVFATLVFIVLILYTRRTIRRRRELDDIPTNCYNGFTTQGGKVQDDDNDDANSIDSPSDSWRNVYRSRSKGSYIQQPTMITTSTLSTSTSAVQTKTRTPRNLKNVAVPDAIAATPILSNRRGHSKLFPVLVDSSELKYRLDESSPRLEESEI